MKQVKSLDILLAGGKGTRLFPVTRDRAKPAAPYGGKYRIIDLPINNHVNSGSRNILVIAQYQPASLMRHIQRAWAHMFEKEGTEFIRVVQPEHTSYKGTADAVYHNLKLIEDNKPDIVTIFCGDHVYLMDIAQMKQFHLDHGADLTIAAMPVRRDVASGNLGVLVANENNDLVGFQEKPINPAHIPGMEDYCWASMGNYVFTRQVLLNALKMDAQKEYVVPENKELVANNPQLYTLHDFGFNIIPMLLQQGKKIRMYDYRKNCPDKISTIGYWRDVGTLDQFIEANMDLVGPSPRLVLENPGWPLVTYDEAHGKETMGAEHAINSILANGVTIEGPNSLERCIISYSVTVGERCEISDSIIMGHNIIGRNVRIKRAVIDRGVSIPDGIWIGAFHEDDKVRGLTISPNGYTIVPRNYEFK